MPSSVLMCQESEAASQSAGCLRLSAAACRGQGDRLFTKVVYPTASSSEVRTRLRMRSTVRGANNRLDILAITSYDRNSGSSSDLSGEPALAAQSPPKQTGHWLSQHNPARGDLCLVH